MQVIKFSIFHRYPRERYLFSEIHIDAGATVYPKDGATLSLDRFVEKITSREFTTQLEPNDCLLIPLFGVLVISDTEFWRILPKEFVKELSDAVRFLNDEETSLDGCLAAFRECVINPDATRRGLLERAWEAVPAHHRRGLLSMDLNDGPIRRLIRGELHQEEIEQLRRYPELKHVWSPTRENRLAPFQLVTWPDDRLKP